jgi:cell wall-associated NlpC family hydrolase
MTLTRRIQTPRFLLSTAIVTFVLSVAPVTAGAMILSDAVGNLKDLHPTDAPTVPTLRDRIVEVGLDAVGTRYTWGGDDPDGGFDCSGLVSFVYKEVAGVDLPRRATDQRGKGKAIQTAQLQPGDLVFFGTNKRRRNQTSHVGIYIGNNQFVHAPTRGSTVRVDDLDSSYWSKHFNGARRYIAPPAGQAVQLASSSTR